MDKKTARWLASELPQWQKKGWLTAKGVSEMPAFYRNRHIVGSPSLFRLLLVAISIALIIGGITLLVAGGWYSFSPNGRFDLALSLVVLALLGVAAIIAKALQGSVWAEGVGLFSFFAVMLSSFLVGETYYLGESRLFGGLALLTSLPLIYLLQSRVTLFVYLLVFTGWSLAGDVERLFGGAVVLWLFLILPAPFYVASLQRKNRPISEGAFLTWAYVLALYSTFVATLQSQQMSISIILLAAIFTVTYLLTYLFKSDTFLTKPFRWIGGIGIFAVLFEGSFTDTWSAINQVQGLAWIGVALAVLFLPATTYVALSVSKTHRPEGLLLGCMPFVVAGCSIAAHQGVGSQTITVIFTLYVFLLALYLILRGVLAKRIALLNWGLIFLFMLMLARFFDPVFTFFERGITFVVAGIFLLSVNLLYMKNKHSRAKQPRRTHRKVAQRSIPLSQVEIQSEPTLAEEGKRESTVSPETAVEDSHEDK